MKAATGANSTAFTTPPHNGRGSASLPGRAWPAATGVLVSGKGSIRKKGYGSARLAAALFALLLVIMPATLQWAQCLAQTKKAPATLAGDTQGANASAEGEARKTRATAKAHADEEQVQTSVIAEAAQHRQQTDIPRVISRYLQNSYNQGQYNDTYLGLKALWSDDVIGNFFTNIGQLIGKWISEVIEGWIADAAKWLTENMRVFVLNPNIAVNGLNGREDDGGLSRQIRAAANIVYEIAIDLLLLLFILCIWKFWAEAAWRGGSNLMGAVGRLIFTAGLMLVWPTIYAFTIQITNEMIMAIGFGTPQDAIKLDVAMREMLKAGLLAAGALASQAFAPVVTTTAGGAAFGGIGGALGKPIGGVIAFFSLLVYGFLGFILIAELLYIIILKAMQTAILTAQYMFAPVFLVCFATPDTEKYCAGFVKTFVEVSLWSFVWIGLLKVLVLLINSDFNPWGKILTAIGILQLMIQVPSFLAQAGLSPASDFVNAGNIHKNLQNAVSGLGNFAYNGIGRIGDYYMNQRDAARGLPKAQTVPTADLNAWTDQNELQRLRNSHQTARDEAERQRRELEAQRQGRGIPGGPNAQQPTLAVPPTGTPPQRQGNPDDPANRLGAGDPEVPQPTLTTPGGDPAAQGTDPLAQGPPTQPGTTRPAVTQPPATGRPTQPVPDPHASGPQRQPVPPAPDPNTTGANQQGQTTLPPARAATPLEAAIQQLLAEQNRPPGDPNRTESPLEQVERTLLGNQENPVMNWTSAGEGSWGGWVAIKSLIGAIRQVGIKLNPNAERNALHSGVGGDIHAIDIAAQQPGETNAQAALRGAHALMHAGLTRGYQDDDNAWDAARQAAIDAGADEPQGLGERIAAGFMAAEGRSFKQTARAKQRFQQAMLRAASEGAAAYLNYGDGNAYTQYLRERHGEWTPERDGQAVFALTTPDSSESPWNPGHNNAGENLAQSNLSIGQAQRGGMMHPLAQAAMFGKKKSYAMAALLVTAERARQYEGSPDHARIWGEMARHAPNDLVEDCAQLLLAGERDDLGEQSIRHVGEAREVLHSDTRTAYRALRTAMNSHHQVRGSNAGGQNHSMSVIIGASQRMNPAHADVIPRDVIDNFLPAMARANWSASQLHDQNTVDVFLDAVYEEDPTGRNPEVCQRLAQAVVITDDRMGDVSPQNRGQVRLVGQMLNHRSANQIGRSDINNLVRVEAIIQNRQAATGQPAQSALDVADRASDVYQAISQAGWTREDFRNDHMVEVLVDTLPQGNAGNIDFVGAARAVQIVADRLGTDPQHLNVNNARVVTHMLQHRDPGRITAQGINSTMTIAVELARLGGHPQQVNNQDLHDAYNLIDMGQSYGMRESHWQQPHIIEVAMDDQFRDDLQANDTATWRVFSTAARNAPAVNDPDYNFSIETVDTVREMYANGHDHRMQPEDILAAQSLQTDPTLAAVPPLRQIVRVIREHPDWRPYDPVPQLDITVDMHNDIMAEWNRIQNRNNPQGGNNP